MRKRAFGELSFCLLILATVSSASAHASSAGTCQDPSADPEQRISNCTTLIDAGSLAARDLASAMANRASAREAQEDFTGALQDYDEAASRDPASARALKGACRLRAIANRDLQTAAQLCERARSLASASSEPSDSNIDGRELLMLRLDQQVQTLLEYDRLLSQGPRKATTLFMRAVVKRQLGDHVGADEDFAAASELDERVPALFKTFGIADVRTADAAWLQKIGVARSMSALNSGFHFSSQMLPELAPESESYDPSICAQSEQLERALSECRRMIRDGDISGLPLAAIEGRCAEIEFLLGRHGDAARDLERAARHDPWNRGYQANLIVVRALAAK